MRSSIEGLTNFRYRNQRFVHATIQDFRSDGSPSGLRRAKLCGWGFGVDSQSPIRRAALCAIHELPVHTRRRARGPTEKAARTDTKSVSARKFARRENNSSFP
jgi:hypothetical protein